MKKYIIRNTIILIAIFILVSIVSLGMYYYVNNLLVKQTISVNLKAIGDTITNTINIKLENDKDQLEKYLSSIPNKESLDLDEQIAYANEHFDELSLSTKVSGGFGSFYTSRQETYYLIDNVRYIGINSSYNFEYEKQDIAISNFKINYESYSNDINKIKVENQFTDKYYVIFRLSNNLIAYLDATPYFDFINTSMEEVKIKQYYIIGEDGIIIYQGGNERNKQFYDLLRENNNNEVDVENILQDVKSNNASLVYENIKIDKVNYFISISNLTNFDETKTIYDLHTVILLDDEKISVFTKPISISLIAIVVFLNLISIGVCILSYFLAIRKYHIMDKFSAFTANKDVFAIEFTNKGKIIDINKALKNLLFDARKYKNITDFAYTLTSDDIKKEILERKEIVARLDFEDTKTGNEYYIRFVVANNFFNKIMIGIDVTNEEKRKEKLLHVALYNSDTELPNVYLLEERLESDFSYMKDHPVDEIKTYLVSFDIENFNNLNVLFGEYMGGKVLKEISNKIIKSLNEAGGELFIIKNSSLMAYFYNITDGNIVEEWIRNILIEFKTPLKIDQNNIVINLYFGILKVDFKLITNLTPSLAIDFATRTVTKVMAFANKRYDYFDLSISNFVSSEKLLEQDLLGAIEKQEFKMYLQPQYDNEKNRICGFESLIRWENPKYRGQSPAHFIEVAERNSMIVQIGRFIFEETFRLAKELEAYDVTISVNISPVQLLQAGFTSEIIEIANKYQIDPHKIAIEITETFLMENFKDANEKLTYLRNHGFLIHLDDFGTGYSSLLYIKELHVDAIKIDREFTKNLNNDQYSRIIVSKIIGIAKSLDLSIIAEGVEDEKQNSFLQKNGCNIIQGYWISRAACYEDALKLLDKYNIKKELPTMPDVITKKRKTK